MAWKHPDGSEEPPRTIEAAIADLMSRMSDGVKACCVAFAATRPTCG
jgi:hypothetical protein